MSQTDELLDNLSEEEIQAYSSDPETEPHIVVGSDRYITVPDENKKIGVQYDHNIETLTFDCIRYWDGHDLFELAMYINYMRADGEMNSYLVTDKTVDEDDSGIIHFTWTISGHVTCVKGNIKFLICAKETDENGVETLHWNSELNDDLYVSAGMECNTSIAEVEADIITQLLMRMDTVERNVDNSQVPAAIEYYQKAEAKSAEAIEYYQKAEATSKEYYQQAEEKSEELLETIETERSRIDNLLAEGSNVLLNQSVQTLTIPEDYFEHWCESGKLGGKFTGTLTSNGITVTVSISKIVLLVQDEEWAEDDLPFVEFGDLADFFMPLTPIEYPLLTNGGSETGWSIVSKDGALWIRFGGTTGQCVINNIEFSYPVKNPQVPVPEIEDMRVDVDGTVHPTAGEAMRSQIRMLRNSGGNVGGAAIIDVESLPLINFNNNAFYRVNEDTGLQTADIWYYDENNNPPLQNFITMMESQMGGKVSAKYLVDALPTTFESFNEATMTCPIYILRSSGEPYFSLDGESLISVLEYLDSNGIVDKGTYPLHGPVEPEELDNITENGFYATYSAVKVTKLYHYANGKWNEVGSGGSSGAVSGGGWYTLELTNGERYSDGNVSGTLMDEQVAAVKANYPNIHILYDEPDSSMSYYLCPGVVVDNFSFLMAQYITILSSTEMQCYSAIINLDNKAWVVANVTYTRT